MNTAWDLDYISLELSVSTRADLFRKIAADVMRDTGLDSAEITAALHRTERGAPSMIEGGVFVPNAVLTGLNSVRRHLYRLDRPLLMADTPDGRAVDLIFVVMSPEEDGPLHLRRLSRVSRIMSNPVFAEKLRQLDDKDAIRSQFLYPEDLTARRAA